MQCKRQTGNTAKKKGNTLLLRPQITPTFCYNSSLEVTPVYSQDVFAFSANLEGVLYKIIFHQNKPAQEPFAPLSPHPPLVHALYLHVLSGFTV